ncbi:MAG: Flp pilus assembly complex ATPase component TadA, partial [Actinobacteria bacterium]|nr:Flp pilus assembly complex ATPase component TadA [Actinomycetota bacterium]
VRDAETADIAIRAALTGHMVFSTIHTNDASGALTRLTDMGVEPFLIASSVNAVIAQRLARTLCPRCRGPYNLPMEAPERLGLRLPDGPITLYRAGGCSWCNNTGYRGRLALFELLVVTPEIRELVTKKAPASDIYRVAVEQGMLPLARDGAEKAMKGLTTLDEVMRVAYSDER